MEAYAMEVTVKIEAKVDLVKVIERIFLLIEILNLLP
jgi:hypothetical protein